MTCVNCGAELPSGALFCGECGQAVAPPVLVPVQSGRFSAPPTGDRDESEGDLEVAEAEATHDERELSACEQCGTPMGPGEIFCSECGHVSPTVRAAFASVSGDTSIIDTVRPITPAGGSPRIPPAVSSPRTPPSIPLPPTVPQGAPPPAAAPVSQASQAPQASPGSPVSPAAPPSTPVSPPPRPASAAPASPAQASPTPSSPAQASPAPSSPAEPPLPAPRFFSDDPPAPRPPATDDPTASDAAPEVKPPVRRAPPAPEPDGDIDDLEATRIVAALGRGDRFVLQFSTGESVTVYGAGLVGRNPVPEQGEHFDHLVRVLDPTRSVSKTHLEIGQQGGAFWVRDRYSGNGTVVREPDRPSYRCDPGKRHLIVRGTRVDIGEQFFIVS